jgi:hypothetical protein
MNKFTFFTAILFLAFLGCQKETPTSPQEKGQIFIGFSLKAAREVGATITRVNVSISKDSFTDSLDLTVSADSAWGTFTNLVPGTYLITVKVYDGTTLLGTGSGQGTVFAGQTTTVRITVNLNSGNLQVIVDWIIRRITRSSSGKIFHNTGVFPDSFQLWYLYEGVNNPWTQSNTVGNPAPSVTYSNSGINGSNGYTMGGVTSSLIYQADVMFTNPLTAEGIYMYFRMVDRQNYYIAKYGPYYGGVLGLGKNVGGVGSEIVPSLYGLPSSANTWYNLEVRAIGSSLQVYFDHTLKINATDTSFASGLTGLSLGICCSASNTWYMDNIKVFKSYQITVNNLQQGQRVEIYDSTGSLKASGTVAVGNTSLVLDVSSLSFPFSGYFKVYNSSGILLLISQTYNDIWGGDTYRFW